MTSEQMIKFFRKIRQKLLTENKFSKYLLYAIGEILLVVIGILLALQINNWNTSNQETKELHNHLKNIKNNLQADLIGIKEISIFRDSSSSYSINFLRLTQKEKITIEDLYSTVSKYDVFVDNYFKPRKSGFETLKNSGYIGKLSGTKIEIKLNDYYYIIDKISEYEESLNNTVESLEIIAHADNNKIRLFDIYNEVKKDVSNFNLYQNEIKELINHPSRKGANLRNSDNEELLQFYSQIEQIANDLMSEIDKAINNSN
ncbi:hypothetical protein NA63_1738 [Flavobacteriaceae bacterium MAR_2010_105]|nr:hypothetical protein NA63_1738 [Flavobacteriaceae bacterium MAR_2010_105]